MIRIIRSASLSLLTLAAGIALTAAPSLRAQRPPQKPLPPGYVRLAPVTAKGLAPKMRVDVMPTAASKTYRVTFGTGDELVSGLTEFAEKNHVTSARITGLGGLITAKLGWGDPAVRALKEIDVDKKCELVSLIGNISSRNGHPYVHLHGVVAFSDGSTKGGHVIEAHVNPIAEIYVVTSDQGSAGANR